MGTKPDLKKTKPRPFWQQYLFIMVIDIVIVLVGSLMLGNIKQMTNLFFWSTFLFLIVAVIPIIFEVGSSAKVIGKAIKDREEIGDQLKEKQSTFDRGARITYLFGLAAFTTFLLALLSLTIG
jgi:hypothetical protein